MNRIRAYVSHPIRGIKGKDATREDMEANNRRAIEFGKMLRERFPTVEFYIPAEHDEFVLEAYEQGSLTENEILDADCAIVRKCNFLLALTLDDHLSRGMFKEMREASRCNIPILVIENDEAGIQIVNQHLSTLMRG